MTNHIDILTNQAHVLTRVQLSPLHFVAAFLLKCTNDLHDIYSITLIFLHSRCEEHANVCQFHKMGFKLSSVQRADHRMSPCITFTFTQPNQLNLSNFKS